MRPLLLQLLVPQDVAEGELAHPEVEQVRVQCRVLRPAAQGDGQPVLVPPLHRLLQQPGEELGEGGLRGGRRPLAAGVLDHLEGQGDNAE